MSKDVSIGVHVLQSHMDFSHLELISQTAEDLGFDSITLMDHLRPVSFTPPKTGNFLECWTSLGAIAIKTSKIKIGSMVTCASFRNPALLAKMASSIDHISNGRLKLGVGSGWSQSDFDEYGYSFSNPKERIERLCEMVQIIKYLWEFEEASFEGKYYKIKNAVCYPRPVQKPFPPIFIGGGGEKYTLKVVAKHANGWNTSGPLKQYSHKLTLLENYCTKIGRDIDQIRLSWLGWVIPSSDPKKIIRYLPETSMGMEEVIERHLIGSADHCVRKIKEFLNIGVTDFELVFPDTFPVRRGIKVNPSLNTLQWFVENVIPELN